MINLNANFYWKLLTATIKFDKLLFPLSINNSLEKLSLYNILS